MKGILPSLILGALLLLTLQSGSKLPATYASSPVPTISVVTPQNNSIITVPSTPNCNDTSANIILKANASDPNGLAILAESPFNGVAPSWSPVYGAKSVNGWGSASCETHWNNSVISSSFILTDDGRILEGSPHQFNVTLVDGGHYNAMLFANNTLGGFTIVKIYYTLRISNTSSTPANGQPSTTLPTLAAPLAISLSLATVLLFKTRKRAH